MKSCKYAVVSALLFTCQIAAAIDDADPLVPYIDDRKIGFLDIHGKIRIPPTFGLRVFNEWALNFQEGLQAVQIGDSIGYINREGHTVIQPVFEQALSFKDGLAPVRDQNGKWGFIDRTGTFVIAAQFEEANQFSDGLAQVAIDHKMGYINLSGQFVIPPQYTTRSHFSNFREGLACVCVSNKWGFITTNGSYAIPPRFITPSEFSSGLAPVQEGERISDFGYINPIGQFVIPAQYHLAWGFSEGLARVAPKHGPMQFISPSGDVIFDVENGDWAGAFSEGLVNVCVSKRGIAKRWGYMDKSGTWIIEPQFDQAEAFHSGIATVALNQRIAYIDRSGNIIWKMAHPND